MVIIEKIDLSFFNIISSSQSRPLELRIWTFVQVRHFVSWRFHILVLDLKRSLPQMSTIDRDSVFQSNPLYKIPCGHFYSVAAMNNQFTAKVWKRSMFVTWLHPFQMFMEPPYKAPTAPYQDECSCFAFIWFSVDFCFFPDSLRGSLEPTRLLWLFYGKLFYIKRPEVSSTLVHLKEIWICSCNRSRKTFSGANQNGYFF